HLEQVLADDSRRQREYEKRSVSLQEYEKLFNTGRIVIDSGEGGGTNPEPSVKGCYTSNGEDDKADLTKEDGEAKSKGPACG
ncbi:hypothetical protein DVH05_004221, partial [Phytophthora capsici]